MIEENSEQLLEKANMMSKKAMELQGQRNTATRPITERYEKEIAEVRALFDKEIKEMEAESERLRLLSIAKHSEVVTGKYADHAPQTYDEFNEWFNHSYDNKISIVWIYGLGNELRPFVVKGLKVYARTYGSRRLYVVFKEAKVFGWMVAHMSEHPGDVTYARAEVNGKMLKFEGPTNWGDGTSYAKKPVTIFKQALEDALKEVE